MTLTASHRSTYRPHRDGGPVRGLGKYGRPTYNQAAKIIEKFGGESAFAKILGISRITAYRWNYARPYGCDGLVPAAMVERVHQAARVEGIVLTPKDWAPERIDYSVPIPNLFDEDVE